MANTFMRSANLAYYLAQPETECCEHVEADKSKAYVVVGESDSFGPLTRFVQCKECDVKAQEQAAEQLEYCVDCKTRKPAKVCRGWRWYDFYAAQGDEEIHICDDCRQLPKHKTRVHEDKMAEREEFGRDEDQFEYADRYNNNYDWHNT